MSEEKNGGGISLATKSRFKTPENFFPVVVDDFFNDPKGVVDYGKSLPKEPSPDGLWPGNRSKLLWGIDEDLQIAILVKILSCYYDLDYIDISWESAQMYFQEIPRFSKNKNDIKNRGWIHQDYPCQFLLAGLIYLTPNIDPDSGTSLYNAKSTTFNKGKRQDFKRALFKDDRFDREEYTKNIVEHEENFFEKVRFQNIFNRLIMYDTCEWHRANSYYNDDGEDARLTLVFSVGRVGKENDFRIEAHPLKRIKNHKI